MSHTESTMLPLGTPAPELSLPDVVSGKTIALNEVVGPQGVLVIFLCPHCPFVKHLEHELAALGRDYADSGLGIVGISSNDAVAYPADSPAGMKAQAEDVGFPFPYLYDEPQEVARAYRAACTPDFFLFDRDRRLVYRGQFDGSRPGNNESVTGSDLREAMEALLTGQPIPQDQRASIGCNIKWKTAASRRIKA